MAERERASLANRVRQLEELLDEARAKVAAAGKGPLEQEQQLLLVKAELKEAYSQVTKAQETAAKLSGALKEKDEEVARLRSAIAAEVNDAAQQVQELLAAQARSEQLEARVAELTGNVQKAPVQSWEGFHVMQ